MALAMIAEM